MRKLERRLRDLARRLLSFVTPAQSPRNHQVNDDVQMVRQTQYDAFAHSRRPGHLAFLDSAERRIYGAQNEWIDCARPLERVPYGKSLQRFDVNGDVRKLGHRAECKFPFSSALCANTRSARCPSMTYSRR